MLLAQQFQNSALARYPNAARELAVFAFASSVFQLFNAALIFMPQMSNSFVRSPQGWRICLRFTLWLCLILSLPLALIRRTTGRMGAGAIFRNVATYLLAALFFYTGLLDHITATLTLIAGFVAETLVMIGGPCLGRVAQRGMARMTRAEVVTPDN